MDAVPSASETGHELSTTPAVRARGLVKRYGDHLAVDNLDLDIPRGGCFGVLGPNGAGKTTTIKMITTLSPPTAGTLEVLGMDVGGDRRALKRRLGVVPQGDTLDYDLTVRENLLTFARYHDIPRPLALARAAELLEFAQLTDRAGDIVEELSGGMLRRVLIARALVNDPELAVLDEPTTGLDPQARHLVWERLRSLKQLGKTLLLTTHYMDEAAQLCDRLVVMDHGKIIAGGTPRELIEATVPPRVVEVDLTHSPGVTASDDDQDHAEVVQRALGTLPADVEKVGERVLLHVAEAEPVIERLRAADLNGAAVTQRDATLEDVFLKLTGRTLDED
jgi:lipooligosaccharide transport system ATP-binding protein